MSHDPLTPHISASSFQKSVEAAREGRRRPLVSRDPPAVIRPSSSKKRKTAGIPTPSEQEKKAEGLPRVTAMFGEPQEKTNRMRQGNDADELEAALGIRSLFDPRRKQIGDPGGPITVGEAIGSVPPPEGQTFVKKAPTPVRRSTRGRLRSLAFAGLAIVAGVFLLDRVF